jgi:hypothetical protein
MPRPPSFIWTHKRNVLLVALWRRGDTVIQIGSIFQRDNGEPLKEHAITQQIQRLRVAGVNLPTRVPGFKALHDRAQQVGEIHRLCPACQMALNLHADAAGVVKLDDVNAQTP